MGPGDLKQTICSLTPNDERILVGFDTSEDASVYQINEDQAIVQTLDFITPVVASFFSGLNSFSETFNL
jgi:selenide,water dikinase